MLNHKEKHEKSSLTLSLSFWLHAERNGFYLGSDILGGSYVQATAPNIANIINNLSPQSYPSNPSPNNSSNSSNSNTVSLPGGTGGLFSEISFGYKYFLGKKRIIGFRHSLFFGYQVGGVGSGGLIAFLPYGFDTDLLIGMNIGGSTWFVPSGGNEPATTTIFQLQGKFGVRWNRDKYNAGRYLGGSSIELGVKVPAFGVSDNTLRRWVSVYFNYTYNFKNKN
ncbi:outer membrane beta-barrel protein [Helicobacter pylori]